MAIQCNVTLKPPQKQDPRVSPEWHVYLEWKLRNKAISVFIMRRYCIYSEEHFWLDGIFDMPLQLWKVWYWSNSIPRKKQCHPRIAPKAPPGESKVQIAWVGEWICPVGHLLRG